CACAPRAIGRDARRGALCPRGPKHPGAMPGVPVTCGRHAQGTRPQPARAAQRMAILIRLARESDAAAIASIYRPYVEDSRISFEVEAPDAAEIARRMGNPIHPWLVAE